MSAERVAPSEDPTRVMVRRILAYLVDALLVVLGIAVVIWITGDVKKVPDCDNVPPGRACFGYSNLSLEVNEHALVWFFLTAVVMSLLIVALPQAVAGTSGGKALFGLRVVRPDGSKPGWRRSLVRLAAWVLDGFALLLPVAFWSAVLTPGHRRVGDYLAGTYVVRKDATDRPVHVSRPTLWPHRRHVGLANDEETAAPRDEPAGGGDAGDPAARGLRE